MLPRWRHSSARGADGVDKPRLWRRFALPLIVVAKQSTPSYGGQAVIEGVMMRSPSYWTLAVRKPNGEIAEVSRPIDSLMKRHLVFRLPVIRGIMALGESLAIGFRALSMSTHYALEEDDGTEGIELSRWAIVAMFTVAIVFALGMFKVGPAFIASAFPVSGSWFVLVEGVIRVTVLIAYMALVSLLPDIRRVFAYHGAEHKVINAYEAGAELTPEKVKPYTVIHPRCGTAFLLWVMVIAIFVYMAFGRPAWYWLLVTRILMLPLIAGIAYELIRFAGKHRSSRVLATVLAPGLWLQRLTTREPSLEQIEVSIAAFTLVRRLEEELTANAEQGAESDASKIEVMA